MAAKKNPVSFQNVASAKSDNGGKAIASPVAVPATAPVTAAAVAAVAAVAAAATAPAGAAAVVRGEPVRDRSTIIALIARLHDSDAEAARDAAVTLGTLPVDAEAISALCDVLRNTRSFFHPVVRAAAASALGRFKDMRAFDALLHATADTMAEASDEAIKSLGILGDRRAVSTLEKIVRNDNGFFLESVRKTAEESLRRIRG